MQRLPWGRLKNALAMGRASGSMGIYIGESTGTDWIKSVPVMFNESAGAVHP